jgi:hypothetical protein
MSVCRRQALLLSQFGESGESRFQRRLVLVIMMAIDSLNGRRRPIDVKLVALRVP